MLTLPTLPLGDYTVCPYHPSVNINPSMAELNIKRRQKTEPPFRAHSRSIFYPS